MTRRRILIFAAAFLVTFAAVIAYQIFSKLPALTVVLRCAENTNGKLIVTTGGAAKNFDAAAACQAGKITVGDFSQGDDAKIVFENAAGERGEVLSKYGENIQSDPHGFFVVIKISHEKPFVFNDKL